MVNDSSFYPDTEVLNDNAQKYVNTIDNNKDYYSKYQNMDKHFDMENSKPPTAPPRNQKKSKQLLQEELSPNQNNATTLEAHQAMTNSKHEQITATTNATVNDNNSQNIPNLSVLMTKSSLLSNSIENNCTASTVLSEANIPLISLLASSVQPKTENTPIIEQISSTSADTHEILPVISALNLNGEKDEIILKQHSLEINETSSSSSLSNDSSDNIDLPAVLENAIDVDDDASVPNLSIFENNSTNNDSSLTNVTGTSGENSFDLSLNEGSSESNENIPCLSALNQ